MNIFKLKYTLRTFSRQETVGGYAVCAPYKDRTVMLDVQPVVQKDLQSLPEGERATKNLKSYGSFPIQTADVEQGYKADQLFYDGEWYECVSSSYYEHTPLRHWKSLWVRVSEAANEQEMPTDEEEEDDDY